MEQKTARIITDTGLLTRLRSQAEEIARYGRLMEDSGLTEGTSGNLSIYNADAELMLITPSGVPYSELDADSISLVDLEGNPVCIFEEGKSSFPARQLKPSSEYALHAAIYGQRRDARAIVHAHSIYCTTLACMGETLKPIHYALTDAQMEKGYIPLVRYETFGTPQLAEAVEEQAPYSRGLLLANHGMLACGESMPKAFSLAKAMEWCAQIQWRCMCAGQPVCLTDEQMAAAAQRFRSYGQKKDPGSDAGYF